MKKFYKDVTTGPAVGGGHVVLLDGRPVRTPAKALMNAPTAKLADMIAAEWTAQEDIINTETMPLTQILVTAIDRAGPQREAITVSALAYLDSDLLCYHADEPAGLMTEQAKLWTPWLRWFEKRFGGIPLHTTYALARLDQPQAAHDAVAPVVDALDIQRFTVFQIVTNLTGSIVLGLAFIEDAASAGDALACTLCEELYYERTLDLEKHGLDPNETRRRAALKRDLDAAAAYLQAI